MKNLILVIASALLLSVAACTKQASHQLATEQSRKGGKNAATLVESPTIFIPASVSGATVTWSGLPDTVHVTQIAICSDTTFTNPDPLNPITFSANLYLQYPVTSTSNYVTSFTIPSTWFSGTRFVRIQGDYYSGSSSGLYFSNTLSVTLP